MGDSRCDEGLTGCKIINVFFDRRPGAIIRDLGLRGHSSQDHRPRHFGRDDSEFPWERTNKAEALKKAAGS